MATQSMENTGPCECGVCGEYDASVLCEQCEMGLCAKCEKGHKKIPSTKNHNFKPLTKDAPNEGSASYDESGDIFCSEHPSIVVTMICYDCTEIYCPSCAHTHGGHQTVSITADIHHIQQISMESLQSMIAGFKGLGQRKKDMVTHSTLCEEAENKVKAKWEEIVEAGNEYVDTLCEEIQAEKKDIDSKLSGPLDSVSERMTKTDDQISRLNTNKTSAHRHLILRGILQSTITQKLNAKFMSTSEKYKNPSTIEKMLPNIGKADDVKQLLNCVFSMSSSWCQVNVDFSKFGKVGEQHVGDDGYRICDDGVTDYKELVLSRRSHRQISVHNTFLSKITATQSNTSITHLAKISDIQFVSAYGKDVKLLDNKYQVVKIKNDNYDSSEYYSKTICSNGKNSFIECCIGNPRPYRLYINRVDVRNNDFLPTNIMSLGVDAKGENHQMYCRKHENILVFAQDKTIHIIDLDTKSVNEHDLSDNITGSIWSLSLDAPGCILVGDDKSVHVYSKSMEYMMEIYVGGYVHGILYINDSLFVSKRANYAIIQKYKLQA